MSLPTVSRSTVSLHRAIRHRAFVAALCFVVLLPLFVLVAPPPTEAFPADDFTPAPGIPVFLERNWRRIDVASTETQPEIREQLSEPLICPDIIMLAARGSGQANVDGVTGQPVVNEVAGRPTNDGHWDSRMGLGEPLNTLLAALVDEGAARGKTVGAISVDYEAVEVFNPYVAIPAALRGAFGGVAGSVGAANAATKKWVSDSAENGAIKMRDQFGAAIRRCVNSRFVLAGYSQGAQLMHMALQDEADTLAERSVGIGAGIWNHNDRIDAVVLVANPWQPDPSVVQSLDDEYYIGKNKDRSGVWAPSGYAGWNRILQEGTPVVHVCHHQDPVCSNRFGDTEVVFENFTDSFHTKYRTQAPWLLTKAAAAAASGIDAKHVHADLDGPTLRSRSDAAKAADYWGSIRTARQFLDQYRTGSATERRDVDRRLINSGLGVLRWGDEDGVFRYQQGSSVQRVPAFSPTAFRRGIDRVCSFSVYLPTSGSAGDAVARSGRGTLNTACHQRDFCIANGYTYRRPPEDLLLVNGGVRRFTANDRASAFFRILRDCDAAFATNARVSCGNESDCAKRVETLIKVARLDSCQRIRKIDPLGEMPPPNLSEPISNKITRTGIAPECNELADKAYPTPPPNRIIAANPPAPPPPSPTPCTVAYSAQLIARHVNRIYQKLLGAPPDACTLRDEVNEILNHAQGCGVAAWGDLIKDLTWRDEDLAGRFAAKFAHLNDPRTKAEAQIRALYGAAYNRDPLFDGDEDGLDGWTTRLLGSTWSWKQVVGAFVSKAVPPPPQINHGKEFQQKVPNWCPPPAAVLPAQPPTPTPTPTGPAPEPPVVPRLIYPTTATNAVSYDGHGHIETNRSDDGSVYQDIAISTAADGAVTVSAWMRARDDWANGSLCAGWSDDDWNCTWYEVGTDFQLVQVTAEPDANRSSVRASVYPYDGTTAFDAISAAANNAITNPSFEDGYSGWHYSHGTLIEPDDPTRDPNVAVPQPRTNMVRYDVEGKAHDGTAFMATNTTHTIAENGGVYQDVAIDVSPDGSVVISAWMRSQDDQAQGSLCAGFSAGDWNCTWYDVGPTYELVQVVAEPDVARSQVRVNVFPQGGTTFFDTVSVVVDEAMTSGSFENDHSGWVITPGSSGTNIKLYDVSGRAHDGTRFFATNTSDGGGVRQQFSFAKPIPEAGSIVASAWIGAQDERATGEFCAGRGNDDLLSNCTRYDVGREYELVQVVVENNNYERTLWQLAVRPDLGTTFFDTVHVARNESVANGSVEYNTNGWHSSERPTAPLLRYGLDPRSN